MNFEPVELKENVNISKGSRVKDAFVLLTGALIIIILLYYLSGLLVDLIAPHLPNSFEKSINSLSGRALSKIENNEDDDLQKLTESLLKGDDRELGYIVYVSKSENINAFALPGGAIVMYKGLLDFAYPEEETAFVIAHELGHFQHYDHIKGFGRRLIAGLIINFVTGDDNTVANVLGASVDNMALKFSRRQEYAADRYAVDRLIEVYGSANGAVNFLRKMTEINEYGKFSAYFSTHPHPENRLKAVIEYLEEKE